MLRAAAAVRSRDEAEGDGFRITQAAALGDLDRVDIADEVSHAGVRGGQFLGVALAAVPPCHRQVVAEFGGSADRLRGDRCVGVLAEFGAGDHWRPLIKQIGQRAQQSGLALSAFAEKHEIVSGDQRTLELRQHGVFESEDAGPDVVAGSQRFQEVFPNLVFDAALGMAGGA